MALQGSTQNQPQHLRLKPRVGKLIRSLSGNLVGFVALKHTVLTSTIPAVNLLGSQKGIKALNNGLRREPDSPSFQISATHLSHAQRASPPYFGPHVPADAGFPILGKHSAIVPASLHAQPTNKGKHYKIPSFSIPQPPAHCQKQIKEGEKKSSYALDATPEPFAHRYLFTTSSNQHSIITLQSQAALAGSSAF